MREPIHNKKFDLRNGRMRPAKRIYTVWLVKVEDDEWRIYHCPDCKNPLAQYKGSLIAEVPGETQDSYPMMVQCKNPNCGRKILFKDAVEQDLS